MYVLHAGTEREEHIQITITSTQEVDNLILILITVIDSNLNHT